MTKAYMSLLLAMLCSVAAWSQSPRLSVCVQPVTSMSAINGSKVTIGKTAKAQGLSDNQRLVGYTVTDDIDVKGAAFGQAGTYCVGAVLTPQMLAAYEGCPIVGIRIAAAMNLGRTRTFIMDVAGNDVVPVVEQNQRLYDGWNNVFFNGEGYTIKGTETLFFGFDYVETEEMVAAEQGGLCGAGSEADGSFYCFGNLGRGLGMYSLNGLGRLCVQLIVDISSLPMQDLDMTYFDTGFKYKKPGTVIEAFATVTNVGRAPVVGFQLGYQLDDEQPVLHTLPADSVLRVGADDSWQFNCRLSDDIKVGMHTLKVFVSQVGGEPLSERSKNDTLSAHFAVYTDSVERSKAYLEVYTDASTYYSALLNDVLASLTADSIMDSLVTVVNVHRPGTPLAVSEAAYLHSLYAYTWPSFTLNRSYFPGEANIAYDVNDYFGYLSLIGTDFLSGIIGAMVMQDFLTPSFASVALQADYDSDARRLTVTASGNVLPEADAIYGDLALTLMVVENGVGASQSVVNTTTGRISTNRNYRHPHVLRGYLTAPTGDVLDTTGGQFTKQVSATLDSGWQTDNISIVALLTKRADEITNDNVRDYDIINAASISLSGTSSVAQVKAPNNGVGQRYTIGGSRMGNGRSPRGIWLERMADGSVRKHLSR